MRSNLIASPEIRASLAAIFALVIFFGALAATLSLTALFFAGAVLVGVGAVLLWVAYRAAGRGPAGDNECPEFGAMVAGLDAAVIAYDEGFRVLHFNPEAERLFQVKADGIANTVIGPQDAERPERRVLTQVVFPSLAPRMLARSPAGSYPQVVDLSFDDPLLELRVTTTPLRNAAGSQIGFMKIVRDRTREVSSLKAKDEFLTVASHQLRTPITELNWALDTVTGDQAIPESSRPILEKARDSAKHLLVIVEDLLGIAKIDEGRFGYQFAPADIVEFLGTIAATALPRAERVGIELFYDRPKDPLPQVTVDKEKLGMVVSNLVDNAIRYNVEHGRVTVGVRKADKGPYVEVSVADTGIGIPPEEMGKIFTKFFRAENAVRSVPDGSGLGLYIARNIVRGHGGEMWADSELSRGSTFTFTLPTDPALVPQHERSLTPDT